MKKGHIKLILICATLAVVTAINCKTQLFGFYNYAFFLLGALVVTKFLMGFEKDNFSNKKELTLIVLMSIIIYYTTTYSTVFFWGILKNSFVLSIETFLCYVVPLFFIIVITELLRYIIIRKGRKYTSVWIIAAITFTLMDVTLKIRGYDFGVAMQVLKFSLEVIAVSLAKNIFLCYLINIAGYKVTILYRSLMDLPFYILPFFPDLGIFIDSVSKMIFPFLLIFVIHFKYSKLKSINEKVSNKQFAQIKKYGIAIITIITLIMAVLSSNKFKYATMVVGSESMSPNINKGDVVLIKKLKETSAVKENDILIFNYEKASVVHRLIRIETKNEEKLFFFKGDANEYEDYYPVKEKNILGIIIFQIKYMGYPTIWLNEKLN